ncbi:MAG: hypothetical protein ACYCXP_03190 [Leptospirillum sp.]|jgi:hypothetical protein|nr:hypothetical protein [Nitrospiraceae bacterium]
MNGSEEIDDRAMLSFLREAIVRVVGERELLKSEMEAWYRENPQISFPRTRELIAKDEELSGLDDRFKALWDRLQNSPDSDLS